jgi:hypothetical protein
MNAGVSAGAAIGLMVGLVIAVILIKVANKDHRVKSQYDERQELIKGQGYKYSFYTMMALEVIVMLIEMSGIELPVENYLVHTTAILIGCLVLCIHSIWNDVYWGLNNDHKRYTIIIVIAVILNLIPLVASIARGSFTTKGFDSIPVLNLLVLIWMAIIGLAALVKKFVSARNVEED